MLFYTGLELSMDTTKVIITEKKINIILIQIHLKSSRMNFIYDEKHKISERDRTAARRLY